jgi:DNA-binding transcriptional LysR family regulator
LVGRFIILYPKTSIDLIITDRIVDLIAERVDLAIRVGPLADSRLVIRKFRSLRGGFWASADYIARKGFPKNPTELKGHDVIRPSRLPEDILLSSPAGEVVEFQRTARLATDDLASLMSLILYGCGIGYLPELFAEHAGLSGSLVRVLPDYAFPSVELNFVYPSQAFVPLTVRAFLAIAEAAAAAARSTDDPGVAAAEGGHHA